MTPLALTVNGESVSVEAEDRTLLADVLRDRLRLTGVHLGCEHGVCGSCTVLVDGVPVRSCLMLAAQASGSEVVTVEGLETRGAKLAALLRESFHAKHALQCGFCTPGFLISAADVLARRGGPGLTEADVRRELAGNICRCTGYVNIVAAVLEANQLLFAEAGSSG